MAKIFTISYICIPHINTPNLANFRIQKKTETTFKLRYNTNIKVSGTSKDYNNLLSKRIQYLHMMFQDFKSKQLAMINKDKSFFHYNSGDLVYIISLLTSQLCTASRKVMIKYVGPVVVYKDIDPHNYL